MQIQTVDLPVCSKGDWKIEKFLVDRMDFRSLFMGREVPMGKTFTRLMRNRTLVMSDTPAECNDHWEAIFHAEGNVLISGLGLGMVLKNILLKPEVKDITVVELSQDLIDLVSPFYTDPRITYVCSSIFEYQPPRGKKYNLIWHDIWDNICGDNIPEMKTLKRKFAHRLVKGTGFQGCWAEYECRRYHR
jgi:hypothetical protein